MASVIDRRTKKNGSTPTPGLAGAMGATAVRPPRARSLADDVSDEVDVQAAPTRRGMRGRWEKARRELLREDNPQATWTTGTSIATRTATAAIALALATGPIAVGLHLFDRNHQPAQAAAPGAEFDERMASRRSVASEVALQWVQAWLTTPASRAPELQNLYAGPVTLPKAAATVGQIRVVDAIPSDTGVWAVSVLAHVVPAGSKVAYPRYFQVLVAVTGGGQDGPVAASPLNVPTPVAGPGRSQAAPGGSYSKRIDVGPARETVEGFISAYLTGQDVSRWVQPGANVTAAVPPGYGWATVKVTDLAADRTFDERATPPDGAQLRVLATVEVTETGVTDATQKLAIQLPLELTARGGRWEISRIDQALASGPPQEQTAPTHDQSPTTGGTATSTTP